MKNDIIDKHFNILMSTYTPNSSDQRAVDNTEVKKFGSIEPRL